MSCASPALPVTVIFVSVPLRVSWWLSCFGSSSDLCLTIGKCSQCWGGSAASAIPVGLAGQEQSIYSVCPWGTRCLFLSSVNSCGPSRTFLTHSGSALWMSRSGQALFGSDNHLSFRERNVMMLYFCPLQFWLLPPPST